jgi:hypothetical protein
MIPSISSLLSYSGALFGKLVLSGKVQVVSMTSHSRNIKRQRLDSGVEPDCVISVAAQRPSVLLRPTGSQTSARSNTSRCARTSRRTTAGCRLTDGVCQRSSRRRRPPRKRDKRTRRRCRAGPLARASRSRYRSTAGLSWRGSRG